MIELVVLEFKFFLRQVCFKRHEQALSKLSDELGSANINEGLKCRMN